MPEIEKTLASTYGYKKSEEKWFLAADADPKKMDEAGKMLFKQFEAMNPPAKPKTGGGGKLPLAAFLSR
jgi:hypothetical protein